MIAFHPQGPLLTRLIVVIYCDLSGLQELRLQHPVDPEAQHGVFLVGELRERVLSELTRATGFYATWATHRLPHLLQVEDNSAVTGTRLGLVLKSIHLHLACQLWHRVRTADQQRPPRPTTLGDPTSVKQLSELPSLCPVLGKLRHNQGKDLAKVQQVDDQK